MQNGRRIKRANISKKSFQWQEIHTRRQNTFWKIYFPRGDISPDLWRKLYEYFTIDDRNEPQNTPASFAFHRDMAHFNRKIFMGRIEWRDIYGTFAFS